MSEGPIIVEAAGLSANTISPGRRERVKLIEAEMAAAVLYANQRGITNPDIIRAMIQKARFAAKNRLWQSSTSPQA